MSIFHSPSTTQDKGENKYINVYWTYKRRGMIIKTFQSIMSQVCSISLKRFDQNLTMPRFYKHTKFKTKDETKTKCVCHQNNSLETQL